MDAASSMSQACLLYRGVNMRSDNYIVIQGWMCNELGLKGNELLIFALIYGFSQDRVSKFCGGRRYISETFDISLPTVDKALQSLVTKNFIAKESANDYKHTDSYFVTDWVTEGVVKKLYEGSKETLLNNIDNTNIDTISINTNSSGLHNSFNFGTKQEKPKKDNLYSKCTALINEFTDDEILRAYLTEFLKRCLANSKESGTPFYTNTFRGKLNKLKTLSTDNYVQRDIVTQTLHNGWSGFYELKTNKRKNDIEYVSAELGIVDSVTYTEEERKQQEAWREQMKKDGKQVKF